MTLIFNNDPTEENTKNCEYCGETVFYNAGNWLHWNTCEEGCEDEQLDSGEDDEDFYIPDPIDLFSTLGEILKPQQTTI